MLLVGCWPSVDIWEAASEGNIQAVKQHLAAGTDFELRCTACGLTVLGHAAWGGHKEIVELLLAEGADVNMKDKSGGRPLHAAVIGGAKEIAELQILSGADVNAKIEGGSHKGNTPLPLIS